MTRPAYLRVGRNAVEDIYDSENDIPFVMDKATVLAEGTDVAFLWPAGRWCVRPWMPLRC